MTDRKEGRFRRALRQVHNRLVAALLFFGCVGGALALHLHPATPLPAHWNIAEPLRVSDPVTPFTGWKLSQALASPELCLSTLAEAASFDELTARDDSDDCFIRNRIMLRSLGETALTPLETSCEIALRSAMWVEHGLGPAVNALGTDLEEILHVGSYNCRRMRTSSGGSSRWSTHATANALDVAGFRLGDGRRITLLQDWDDRGAVGNFLRAARDGACDWFATTLGPDFNRLHADHFHLQHTGWGTCR